MFVEYFDAYEFVTIYTTFAWSLFSTKLYFVPPDTFEKFYRLLKLDLMFMLIRNST